MMKNSNLLETRSRTPPKCNHKLLGGGSYKGRKEKKRILDNEVKSS